MFLTDSLVGAVATHKAASDLSLAKVTLPPLTSVTYFILSSRDGWTFRCVWPKIHFQLLLLLPAVSSSREGVGLQMCLGKDTLPAPTSVTCCILSSRGGWTFICVHSLFSCTVLLVGVLHRWTHPPQPGPPSHTPQQNLTSWDTQLPHLSFRQ